MVTLNNGVITYNITSFTNTAIASNGTGTVQGNIQVSPAAAYNTEVPINSPNYLTNQSTKVYITLLFNVSEAV